MAARFLLLTLPPPLAMAYCWTQALARADLGGGVGLAGLGLAVPLLVLPLLFFFEATYLLLALKVSTPWPTILLTFSLLLGSAWGALLLFFTVPSSTLPLLAAVAIASAALVLQSLLLPETIDLTTGARYHGPMAEEDFRGGDRGDWFGAFLLFAIILLLSLMAGSALVLFFTGHSGLGVLLLLAVAVGVLVTVYFRAGD